MRAVMTIYGKARENALADYKKMKYNPIYVQQSVHKRAAAAQNEKYQKNSTPFCKGRRKGKEFVP